MFFIVVNFGQKWVRTLSPMHFASTKDSMNLVSIFIHILLKTQVISRVAKSVRYDNVAIKSVKDHPLIELVLKIDNGLPGWLMQSFYFCQRHLSYL